MSRKNKVHINVGGKEFVTKEETLRMLPDTKLAHLNTESPEYEEETGEYYFDRDPELFAPILNLYRGQGLHLPKNICGKALRQELEFWDIPEQIVARCCWRVFYKLDRDERVTETMQKIFDAAETRPIHPNKAGNRYYRAKHALWTFLSKPNSSCSAKLWNSLYMLFILVSVSTLVVQTHPLFRVETKLSPEDQAIHDSVNNSKLRLFFRTVAHPALTYIDIICLAVFSVEWLLHLYATPFKLKFLKSPLNVLDIVVILCNWTTVIIDMQETDLFLRNRHSTLYAVYARLKYVSVMRILRFFKLTQRFPSLHIMLISVRKSLRELVMMTMSVFIIATMFGCLLYIVEFAEESVADIPMAIWWATITMTTVGYGDIIPKSSVGRLVGTFCAITGLLVLSMPIAIIASNFNEYHTREKEGDRQKNYRKMTIKMLLTGATNNESKRSKEIDNTYAGWSTDAVRVIQVKSITN